MIFFVFHLNVIAQLKCETRHNVRCRKILRKLSLRIFSLDYWWALPSWSFSSKITGNHDESSEICDMLFFRWTGKTFLRLCVGLFFFLFRSAVFSLFLLFHIKKYIFDKCFFYKIMLYIFIANKNYIISLYIIHKIILYHKNN